MLVGESTGEGFSTGGGVVQLGGVGTGGRG